MKLFGYEIRRVVKTPAPETIEQEFIQAAQNFEDAWAKAREVGLPIGPWIDWPGKRIDVVERTFIRREPK